MKKMSHKKYLEKSVYLCALKKHLEKAMLFRSKVFEVEKKVFKQIFEKQYTSMPVHCVLKCLSFAII